MLVLRNFDGVCRLRLLLLHGGGSWWSKERDMSHCTVQSALNGFAIHHDLAQMSLLCTDLIFSVVGEEAQGIPH